MTLGINTAFNQGGDFMPILKYNADAGRLFRVDRMQDAAGQFVSSESELPQGTMLAFDFGSIEVGWALLAAGMAPSWQMQPLHPGAAQTPAPSKDHRQGFRMKVWSPNLGVREFGATSKTVVGAIDDLHTAFERAPEAHAGQIPVARFSGIQGMTRDTPGGKKTTYKPVFEIVRWQDRDPAKFGERTVPPPNAQIASAAPPPNTPQSQWAQTQARTLPAAPVAAPQAPPEDDASGDWQPSNARHAPPPGNDWDTRPGMMASPPPGKSSIEDDDIPF